MLPARSRARHSRTSTRILKEWFSEHHSYPYPTEDEKEALREQTGLSIRQISYWFVNARRRYTVKRDAQGAPGAPSGPTSSSSIPPPSEQTPSSFIPPPNVFQPDARDNMGPLDRWRNSPPEEEPAPWHAIEQAVGNTRLPGGTEPNRVTFAPLDGGSSSGGGLLPSDSASSIDFSSQSHSSNSSVHSYSSGSIPSLHASGGRSSSKGRRRRNSNRAHHRPSRYPEKSDKRIYQCTFCTDTFRSKYDWTRHEGTLHLTLERWICMPHGPLYREPTEAFSRCVFCDETDPSPAHLEAHDTSKCAAKPQPARTFYRKDHFRQHLRLSHNICEVRASMKNWASKITHMKSRCGFCKETFTLWSDRNDHLARHFRAGALMRDWNGCRGLEPAVALLVENAMPPYLIGCENKNFEPFSASRKAGQASADRPSLPTVFELLTARLGDFVRACRADGVGVTDDMLQREARLMIYDDDDPWNQTPADNPSWLSLFKIGYGLTDTTKTQASPDTSHPTDQQPTDLEPPRVLSPFTLEKMYEVAASDIGTARIGLHSRDPAIPELTVPWPWQSPESLAEFSQMDQMFPVATLGVGAFPQPAFPDTANTNSIQTGGAMPMPSQSGAAWADVPAGTQSSTGSMCGVPGADYLDPLDQSFALPMGGEVSPALVFPFDPEYNTGGDIWR